MKKTASRRSFYAFFCLRARDGSFAAPAASRCCACGRGIGSFAPPGASSFLSSLKESYQRKPLETTFQDFLGAGTAGANLTVCTRGRGAAVITVGQKDCVYAHRRGGFRDRLPIHGRGICFYRVGDYQIAPIAARSTAMGRWRLTPPGVWGRRLRARTPHPPRLRRATCLPAGRSTDLTRHRRVIQHRGPLRGKA